MDGKYAVRVCFAFFARFFSTGTVNDNLASFDFNLCPNNPTADWRHIVPTWTVGHFVLTRLIAAAAAAAPMKQEKILPVILVVSTPLYKRVCPSFRRSVCPSVRPSVMRFSDDPNMSESELEG